MIDNLFNDTILFPIELLDNNWPFSSRLAKEVVIYNGSHYCSSLKTVLLNTAISANSDSDSDLESDTDYIENGDLIDSNFYVKDGKVYYYYFDYGVNEKRVSQEATSTMYCMDNISYDNLMCEAVNFFMKYHIEESEYKDDLVTLQLATFCFVWIPISQLLLYTRYSFFVKNLIEEKKYIEKFQLELMACSHERTLKMRDNEEFYTFFLSEKLISPKERLLNMLSFSTLPRDKREILVKNISRTIGLKPIISYYEKVLSRYGYL